MIRFDEAAVSDEQIEAILEAGRWAPSYINSQPWEFVVVRDPQLRARAVDILRRVTISWQGFGQAPALIVVAVDASKDPRHFVEDAAAAAQNMVLMAHSLGLASFWAGLYAPEAKGSPEEDLKSLLSIPKAFRVVATLPIGFPAYSPAGSRRSLGEMVHVDGYGHSAAKSHSR